METDSSWEARHQDKAKTSLGSFLATTQPVLFTLSNASADRQSQQAFLFSLRLMMLFTLSSGWKSLTNTMDRSGCMMYRQQRQLMQMVRKLSDILMGGGGVMLGTCCQGIHSLAGSLTSSLHCQRHQELSFFIIVSLSPCKCLSRGP